MVATPHLREDHPRVVPEELRPRCDEFNSRLAAEGVPLSVVSGGEVDLLHLPRNRTADSAAPTIVVLSESTFYREPETA